MERDEPPGSLENSPDCLTIEKIEEKYNLIHPTLEQIVTLLDNLKKIKNPLGKRIPLEYDLLQQGTTKILRVKQRIVDKYNANWVDYLIATTADKGKYILGLSKVEETDTSLIAVIVKHLKTLGKQGEILKVIPSFLVFKNMVFSKLDEVIPYPTLEDFHEIAYQ